MTKVMDGIKVVEVASFAFVPSAGAILADWGADVIKVEHAEFGDPMRGIASWGVPQDIDGLHYLFELTNRGKRAVAVDITKPDGLEMVMRIVESADVFMTNFLPGARAKLGIDIEHVMARNPRIVYARGTAQGARGPDRAKGGFDGISYWARTGASGAIAPDDLDWPANMPGPGFGDVQSGMALAGGIAAALLSRERTGKGVVVDTSLYAVGAWAMQPTIVGAQLIDKDLLPYPDREEPANPVSNIYRTNDRRFIHLAMLQSDRYWPGLCAVMNRDDLAADDRFATFAGREKNSLECTQELTKEFATRTLAEWIELLAAQGGQWDVVRRPIEVLDDPQAVANGYVQKVGYGNGRTLGMISAPSQFDEEPAELTPAPGHGEHTDEVLLEYGYAWDEIIDLKMNGSVK